MLKTEEKLLISAREAAELLSISERTLWGLKEDGVIPCVRVRSRVLYSPAALSSYVAAELEQLSK